VNTTGRSQAPLSREWGLAEPSAAWLRSVVVHVLCGLSSCKTGAKRLRRRRHCTSLGARKPPFVPWGCEGGGFLVRKESASRPPPTPHTNPPPPPPPPKHNHPTTRFGCFVVLYEVLAGCCVGVLYHFLLGFWVVVVGVGCVRDPNPPPPAHPTRPPPNALPPPPPPPPNTARG